MERVAVGKVRTSHGVRGFIKVHSLSGEVDHFLRMKELVLKKRNTERSFVVETVRKAGPGELLMKLEGIDSPEEGKSWSGAEILVDPDYAAQCTQNEYYYSDLIGCKLYHEDECLGTVVSLIENGISDLLEVKTAAGKRIVPFQKVFIGEVDTKAGRIELKEPGLLE